MLNIMLISALESFTMYRVTQSERQGNVPSPHMISESARSYVNMKEKWLLSKKPRRARRAIERKGKSAPLCFRECKSPDCMSAIISVHISVF